MAWIYPNSTIHLLENIPLTNAYIHTVDYSDRSAQLQDFLSYSVLSLDNYTYIRNNSIKIEGQIKNLYAVNYLLFKNTNFENKWFYAFVTNVEYLNNETCIITYEIDIMQTYLFDFMAMPSYVERETVTHDDLFASLTDEEIEVGEYMMKEFVHPDYFDSTRLFAIVGVSRKISDTDPNVFEIHNNLLYGMPTLETYYLFTTAAQFVDFYNHYASNGNTEDLLEMVMFPNQFINLDDFATDAKGFRYLKSLDANNQPLSPRYAFLSLNRAVKGQTAFQNYVPKNAKLYNSPFFKIICTDLEGNSVEYSPEYFYTELNAQTGNPAASDPNKMYFMLTMPVNSIPQPQVMPQFYKSKDYLYNRSYIFIGSAFGQMPLLTDTYAAWLAMNGSQLQNQYNILASTKRYTARSGRVSSGIAAIGAQASATSAKIAGLEADLGLSGGYGPSVGGVNIINAAGAATRALGNLDVTKQIAQAAQPGSIAAGIMGSDLLGTVNDMVQTLSTGNAQAARYAARQASGQAALAGIRENYDNEQASLAIQGLNAKITDAQTMSPSVRGMGNANITAALKTKGITLILTCITDEYAERIDRYLSVYGYKVNMFKEIDTKSRRYWNYIKTVNANIVNNGITTKLPHTARIGIKNIFDNGITFWHSGLASVFRYGDYTNPENP